VPATVFPSVSNCLSSPPSLSPPVPFRRCARVWCATCERARLRVVRAGPGEPDCQFFVKTGNCGFGESCKFNHPPEKVPHLLHTCCTLVAHLLHTCCTHAVGDVRKCSILPSLSLPCILCIRVVCVGERGRVLGGVRWGKRDMMRVDGAWKPVETVRDPRAPIWPSATSIQGFLPELGRFQGRCGGASIQYSVARA
jgi:hypothetical protein